MVRSILNPDAARVETRGLSRLQRLSRRVARPAVLHLGSAPLWVSALALLYQSWKGWPTRSGWNLTRLAISCRQALSSNDQTVVRECILLCGIANEPDVKLQREFSTVGVW